MSAGTVTAPNATEASITCTQTLNSGESYTFNITAYNATEVPATTTSSDYTVTVNAFYSMVTTVRDVIPTITALKDLVVAVAPILILVAIVMGLVTLFGDFFSGVFGSLTQVFKKR